MRLERPHEAVENLCCLFGTGGPDSRGLVFSLIFEIGVLGLLLVVVLLGGCKTPFAITFIIAIIILFRLDRGTVYILLGCRVWCYR